MSSTLPPPKCSNGKTYQFVSWSDGGAANHFITTPATSTTYTATYQQIASNPVTVTLNPVADNHVSSRSPTSNYGWSTALWVVRGESYPYLKFDLTALAGKTVTSAVLRVTTASLSSAGSPNAISIFVVADTTLGRADPDLRESAARQHLACSAHRRFPPVNTVLRRDRSMRPRAGKGRRPVLDGHGLERDRTPMGINSREVSPKPQLIITYH